MRFYLFLLLALGLLPAPLSCCAGDAAKAALKEGIDLLCKVTLPKELDEVRITGARATADQKLPKTSMEGVGTLLGVEEQEDYLLTQWWQKSDRASRIAILAIFICQSQKKPPAEGQSIEYDGVPGFYGFADRFAGPEAAQRREEIDFVEDHRSDIAKRLAGLTEGIERLKTIHEQFKAVAGRGIGKKLD